MPGTNESEMRSEAGNSHEGGCAGSQPGGHRGASQLRQAGCVSRGPYTGCSRRGGRSVGGVRCGANGLVAQWLPRESGSVVDVCGSTQGRRRARKRFTGVTVAGQLQILAEGLEAAAAEHGEIPDRRLALLFACAHPAIDAGVCAPLMLQVVVGLDAKTIASAFLTSPAAMGKRLGRAKDKLRHGGIPFSVPEREELSSRLDSVLEAIYAAFAEGWSDPGAADVVRDLTSEAMFLARVVTELLPDEPEALGLLAFLLHAEARRRARRNANGEYVPLAEQDSALWDWEMIGEAEAVIRRASALGAIGRYQLEAALQSAHVYRGGTDHANWADVAQLYDALFALTSSPVVALNRALAIAELHGAAAGLDAMPDPKADARLSEYQPHWAARAELLAKTGANDDARHAYEIAIGLERDPAVRLFLQQRQAVLAP